MPSLGPLCGTEGCLETVTHLKRQPEQMDKQTGLKHWPYFIVISSQHIIKKSPSDKKLTFRIYLGAFCPDLILLRRRMIISIMSQQKSNFRKEEQWDWAVAFYWSSQPIIPTPRLAASDFLHCFDDNVLRQAAKVMTISQCGTVQGCTAQCSNVLALHPATFNAGTRSETDTKVCHEPTEQYRCANMLDLMSATLIALISQELPMMRLVWKTKGVHSPPPPPRRLEFAEKRGKKNNESVHFKEKANTDHPIQAAIFGH